MIVIQTENAIYKTPYKDIAELFEDCDDLGGMIDTCVGAKVNVRELTGVIDTNNYWEE